MLGFSAIFYNLLLQKALLKHTFLIYSCLKVKVNCLQVNLRYIYYQQKALQTVLKELVNIISLIFIVKSAYLKVYKIIEKIYFHRFRKLVVFETYKLKNTRQSNN